MEIVARFLYFRGSLRLSLLAAPFERAILKVSQSAGRYFEPSQLLWAISGLKTNLSPSLSHSAHK